MENIGACFKECPNISLNRLWELKTIPVKVADTLTGIQTEKFANPSQIYEGVSKSFRTESINNNKHSLRSNKKNYGGKTH
jgi:hypothetical protein